VTFQLVIKEKVTTRTRLSAFLTKKNVGGRISIEELTEVMETVTAPLSSEEFESFQRQVVNHLHVLGHLLRRTFQYFTVKLTFREQTIDNLCLSLYRVELMQSLEDNDDHYRKILKEKLQTMDSAGHPRLPQRKLLVS
jgi:GTP pyrophosphokinase